MFLRAFISSTSEINCEDGTQHVLCVNTEGVRGERKKDEMLQSGKMKGTEMHVNFHIHNLSLCILALASEYDLNHTFQKLAYLST